MELSITNPLSDNPALYSKEDWEFYKQYPILNYEGYSIVTFTDNSGKRFIYSRVPFGTLRQLLIKKHGVDLKKCHFKDGKLCLKSNKQ